MVGMSMKLPSLVRSLFAVVAVLAGTASQANAAVVEAVEYYHAGFSHYFMTAFPEEAAALDAGKIAGWARTGKSFYVESAPGSSLSPVCRFFSTTFAPKSSHFYTANASECSGLKSNPNWAFEANSFYVGQPSISGACSSGRKVYRLYNNGQGGAPNHRYTTDTTTRQQMISQGWIPEGLGNEGVAFCASLMDPASAYVLTSRLLGGAWLVGYTFGATYVDKLTFTSVVKNTGSNSLDMPWLLAGVGPFNRPLAGGYDVRSDIFLVVWQFSTGSFNGYGFYMKDANTIEGCYDYDANYANLFASCAYMLGVRTTGVTGPEENTLDESAEQALKEAAKLVSHSAPISVE